MLLSPGKVGARVPLRLREYDIPVVRVGQDPGACGVPLARDLGVPVMPGDITEGGVLEAARVHRTDALPAFTSSDTARSSASPSLTCCLPDTPLAKHVGNRSHRPLPSWCGVPVTSRDAELTPFRLSRTGWRSRMH
ncbi:NAD-binding protein [Streptomyces sp. NPDC056503]|uniref:NAD-binding protein n=1 Tax=Streptomyces sp. NPDC056503 TaxID=3345842 RepID=UPI0036B66360